MKEGISAKINPILIRESKKVAKKRGITFSRLVEVALIHEVNGREFDNGLLTELEDIQNYVSQKISDLSVITESDVKFEIHDEKYYVSQLKELHEKHGRVTIEAVEKYAYKAGVSLEEFLSLLNSSDYDFNIV